MPPPLRAREVGEGVEATKVVGYVIGEVCRDYSYVTIVIEDIAYLIDEGVGIGQWC